MVHTGQHCGTYGTALWYIRDSIVVHTGQHCGTYGTALWYIRDSIVVHTGQHCGTYGTALWYIRDSIVVHTGQHAHYLNVIALNSTTSNNLPSIPPPGYSRLGLRTAVPKPARETTFLVQIISQHINSQGGCHNAASLW